MGKISRGKSEEEKKERHEPSLLREKKGVNPKSHDGLRV